jgi:hypothetical protein
MQLPPQGSNPTTAGEIEMTCGNDNDDSDEFDVDMSPGDEVSGENGLECLGTYTSMEAFLRSQVEHLLITDGLWLMACIDFDRVLRMLESDTYRIWRDDSGRVFRRRLSQRVGP